MDDRDAFEHQLAAEIECQVGPPGSVDAMAVTREAQAPTPKWRISSMFNFTTVSAATAVAIGAIALLLMGAPVDQVQQEKPVPAAAEAAEAPVAFSGSITTAAEKFRPGVVENDGVLEATRDLHVEGSSGMSDARLQGHFSATLNADEYWKPGEVLGVTVFTKRIENDEGAWEGSGVLVDLPFEQATKASITTDVLYGEGAYEGLIAIMQSEYDAMDHHYDVEGVIISRALPPTPETAE